MQRSLHLITRAARRTPGAFALGLAAMAAAVYVIAAPFAASRYPAMTDFPFHAAAMGAIRHLPDPSYHLQEQFELRLVAVPYTSMYVLGAALMTVFPMIIAAKIAAAVMLALLPAGLAVMAHGLKKSPLLGLLGLGVAWGPLTHWGFLNHMGALGLFAMAIGLTARLVDRPSRGRQLALSLCLVALYFTHIFRFPFGICAVIGTAIVLYPATRRFRPILLPLLPPLALFAVWWRIRPSTLEGSLGPLAIHPERLHEVGGMLAGAFNDGAELVAVNRFLQTAIAVAAICLFFAVIRAFTGTGRPFAWAVGATIIPLACTGVFLGLFLVLPMYIGAWWYVYPREAVSTVFLLLASCPDLPRPLWIKAPLVAAIAAGAIGISEVSAKNYAVFDRTTADFDAIIKEIPKAPRLVYLIFDHEGSTRVVSPFMHLPAYVQAEKGGWLGFHMSIFGASPLQYRSRSEAGAVIPPPLPHRFEWRPESFVMRQHGAFFNWFLVRRRQCPDDIFRADPSVVRVDHIGDWWLYRRKER